MEFTEAKVLYFVRFKKNYKFLEPGQIVQYNTTDQLVWKLENLHAIFFVFFH